MDTSNLPEFLKTARFWFAVLNTIILFLPRFGIELTPQEIVQLNLVLSAAFQIAPPVNGYVAAQRYAYAARHTKIQRIDE